MYGNSDQLVVGVGNPFIDSFISLPLQAREKIQDITSGYVHVSPENFLQVLAYVRYAYPDYASHIVSRVGGGALRTLQMLHAASIPVRYYGAVGSDDAGLFMRRQLEETGMDCCLQQHDGITASMMYITYLGGSSNICECVCAPGVSHKLFFTVPADAQHLYIEGYLGESTQVWRELNILFQQAPHSIRAGTLVMIDAGTADAAQRIAALTAAHTQEQIVLILCGTEDELIALHAVKNQETLIKKGIILITKRAERGASVHAREGNWHHPSLADNAEGHRSVGAGDAFSAGFLSCMLRANPSERRNPGVLQESLALGSVYAARHIAGSVSQQEINQCRRTP